MSVPWINVILWWWLHYNINFMSHGIKLYNINVVLYIAVPQIYINIKINSHRDKWKRWWILGSGNAIRKVNWSTWHKYGTKKNLSLQQESDQWSPEHQQGALSIELWASLWCKGHSSTSFSIYWILYLYNCDCNSNYWLNNALTSPCFVLSCPSYKSLPYLENDLFSS